MSRQAETDYRNFLSAVKRSGEKEAKMGSKERVVFHMTDTGDFLVEVKRYRYQAYVVAWAVSHTKADVYVRVKVKGLPVAWSRWDGLNFKRLTDAEVSKLPTTLDSYK